MFIEPLEARIAPAGVIALTLTGTALKISFSSADSISTSVDSNGVFDISDTAGDAFTLNGQPLQLTKSGNATVAALAGHHVGAVSIVDSNGADAGDSLLINGPILGNLSISLSGTENMIVLATPTIQGGVSVKTPAGGTTVFFEAPSATLIGGPVKIALGTGVNAVEVATPQFEVDGAFTYTGGPVKAGLSLVGSNTFASVSGSFLKVAGGLSFSSKFAPSSFTLDAPTIEVGGNLSVVTTGEANGLPTGIIALNSLSVGGNLSITANNSGQIVVGGGSFNVDGKVTVLQGGSGTVELAATSGAMNIGSLSATGHGGGFLLAGLISSGDVSGLVSTGAVMIGGGMKIANFGDVQVAAVGEIGGSASITGASIVEVNAIGNIDETSANGHLAIGGTLTISATPSPATGTAASNTVAISDLLVGGSLTISGNNGGGKYSLIDTGIFGSTTLNLGTKVGATSATVAISETVGDHQTFFANGFTANLPGSGSLTFSDGNSTPDLMVFGQATISEPAGSKLSTSLPDEFFALPVKFATSK